MGVYALWISPEEGAYVMEKNKDTKEFNIQELLYAILNKLWLIILAAAVCGAGMYIYTAKAITPMYRTSVTMYVNNSTKFLDGEQQTDYIASTDLSTSERLVATYITILESNTVLEDVSNAVYETTGRRVSPGMIRSAMSAGSINETEVFRVSISHSDPAMAQAIANAIADAAPAALANIVEGSSTKVVDRAGLPAAPYYPSTMRNAVLGVLIGGFLAVAIVAVTVLMDVRVRSEEDLARLSQAPVLGVIPDFDVVAEKGYSYTSKKSSDISEVTQQ